MLNVGHIHVYIGKCWMLGHTREKSHCIYSSSRNKSVECVFFSKAVGTCISVQIILNIFMRTMTYTHLNLLNHISTFSLVFSFSEQETTYTAEVSYIKNEDFENLFDSQMNKISILIFITTVCILTYCKGLRAVCGHLILA